MHQYVLISLAGIVILGILAQYLAWRFRLPAILLLLVFGILAGPVTGLIDSDALFGELLFPFVSLSVAVILFEGGLSLKIFELRGMAGVVWALVSVGALISWLIASAAAYWLLELELGLAVLLGAILVVTGPTVIIPLLRHVRPGSPIGSIVRWEGIIIDPVGAMLAVLVYEVISAGGHQPGFSIALLSLLKTIAAGGLIGASGAALLYLGLKKYWMPDLLQNVIVLMMVLGVYVAANLLQDESGLFAVTIMGAILANQKKVSIERIVHFKEDLRVLLISILFIVLSARLQREYLVHIGLPSVLFLATLIFIARPVSVALSTVRSKLTWRQRLFIAWMAPRGIVAAAVSSIFALRLTQDGQTEAARLMPLTFLVIIGTVGFYGLTASWAGRWLGVSQPHPQGVLILGAQSWARKIAQALKKENMAVALVDTNWDKANAARMEGLPVFYGSVFSEKVIEQIEAFGLGRLLAMTYNEDVNTLAAVHFRRVFETKDIYQLAAEGRSAAAGPQTDPELRGRILFGEKITFEYLARRFRQGAIVKVNKLTEEFDYEALKKHYGETVVPMFLIDLERQSEVFTADTAIAPGPGDTLISLVDPPSNSQSRYAPK
ncbi:MAG: hypothetical protein AMJ79_02035 [Phycisphaerae bacterium SM23_30]|nr:MAG: hypothetical protein AMJ79_02035 [Phycisphaerae bacterium SM23_30]